MATITFNPSASKTDGIVVDDVKPLVPAIVEKPKTDLVVASGPSTPSGIEGEVTSEDIRPPRLNLVQKSGNLADSFSPGSFVFEKSVVLAKPSESITMTVLRLKKYYQEKVEYGTSNEMPPRFNTAQEVVANGGSLIYGEPRYFQEVADLMVAIKAPEGLDDESEQYFIYSVNGENYALAAYTVAASAYTSLAKRLLTDASLSLRNGLWNGQYKVHSELRKNGTNSWYVPVGTFIGKHDETSAEYFKSLAGL